MKIKSERDFWAGLLFIVIGVAFAVGATYYGLGPPCLEGDPCAADPMARFAQMSARPGAGFFPLGLGALLGVLGAVVLFKSLAIESVGDDLVGPIAWRPLGFVLAAILLFAALLEPLGLVAVVALSIVVASLAGDEVRWKSTLAFAALGAAVAWLLFVRLWPLALPAWPGFAR